MRNKEIMDALASKVIGLLEKEETNGWTKPWLTLGACRNISGHKYRGVNAIATSLASQANGWTDPRFLTFLQAKENGYTIKPKSKGIPIIFWTSLEQKNGLDELGELDPDCPQSRPFMRVSHVFNAEQVIGLDPLPELSAKTPFEVNDEAQNVLAAMMLDGLKVEHFGESAFYSPALDKIVLPPKTLFKDPSGYLGVALHEVGHATGAKHRLFRDLSGKHGSPQYAFEELIAEFSSCFLFAQIGLEHPPELLASHSSYIKHWKEIIKADSGALLRAISAAQKAVDYIDHLTAKPAEELTHRRTSAASFSI